MNDINDQYGTRAISNFVGFNVEMNSQNKSIYILPVPVMFDVHDIFKPGIKNILTKKNKRRTNENIFFETIINNLFYTFFGK